MEFAAKLKQRIYLGRGRVLLRRAGIPRAMGFLRTVWSLRYRFGFRLRPREHVTVRVCELSATFRVSSPSEMERARTLGGEKRILHRLLQEVRPGDVAYDIGTNFGLYTVFLARAVRENGCVIGFEPESRSLEKCEENLSLNSLKNVRMIDRALANEEKEVDLVVDENPSSGAHHVLRSTDGDAIRRRQRIRIAIGDRFIAEQALPIPNLIKIDVEGMEEEVLLGLSQTLHRPECRLVFCEVHFAILDQLGRRSAPARIVKLLNACGFKRIDWLNSGHFVALKRSASEGRRPRSPDLGPGGQWQ